jgi:microcystin-dependent protein
MQNDNIPAAEAAQLYNVPVGTVMPFMGNATKLEALKAKGWLYCNGDAINKNTYNDLFDVIDYNCGGGGDNFNLPDMRGVFVRGVDGGRGQDTDKNDRTKQGTDTKTPDAVGSYQKDEFKAHKHVTEIYKNDGFQLDDAKTGWWPPHVYKPQDSTTVGGSETRPKNISAYYVIFAGLPK